MHKSLSNFDTSQERISGNISQDQEWDWDMQRARRKNQTQHSRTINRAISTKLLEDISKFSIPFYKLLLKVGLLCSATMGAHLALGVHDLATETSKPLPSYARGPVSLTYHSLQLSPSPKLLRFKWRSASRACFHPPSSVPIAHKRQWNLLS